MLPLFFLLYDIMFIITNPLLHLIISLCYLDTQWCLLSDLITHICTALPVVNTTLQSESSPDKLKKGDFKGEKWQSTLSKKCKFYTEKKSYAEVITQLWRKMCLLVCLQTQTQTFWPQGMGRHSACTPVERKRGRHRLWCYLVARSIH